MDKVKAWDILHRMISKFEDSELKVVEKWNTGAASNQLDPEDLDYLGEFYGGHFGGQHYTARVPSVYRVKEAHYRVKGDEVGAVLYREQRKTWEEEGQVDPELSLKELLKVPEAKDEKKATVRTVKPDPSNDNQCLNCGRRGYVKIQSGCLYSLCDEADPPLMLLPGVPFSGYHH